MNDPAVARYGTWRSPVAAELVARAMTRVSEPRLEAGAIWWLEHRPQDAGRVTLVRRERDGAPADVTPEGFNVRTLVHEYGGGAFAVDGPVAYVSRFDDQRLYRLDPGAEPVAITPAPPAPRSIRYADMNVSPDGRWIACVRERHRREGLADNQVVVLPADGSAEPRVVSPGGDFVSFPRFSPDGRRLAWLRWDMPRMPWDGTELLIASIDDGRADDGEVVAGGATESVFQPGWSPAGVLHFVSDRGGWWNLRRLEADGSTFNLTPMAAEFAVPAWEFGYATYAFLDDGRIACTYRRGGEHHLAVLDSAGTELTDVDLPYTCLVPYLAAEGGEVVLVGSGPARTPEIALVDLASRSVEVVRPGEDLGLDRDLVSFAEPIEFPTDDGASAYAYYYPPRNPAFRGPADELPPLVVHAHGGPTSEATPDLKPYVQFFTSRGFAYVDVNYGGSTGHGREFRDRLYGNWGVVDVRDCIAAGRYLASTRRADPARLVVSGGSAGGYIVLAALAFHPDAFAAGTSYFGIADLEPFATDTHKFELRYTDRLVGPWPEAVDLWRERSPINRADAIERPLLLLQGLEDAIVPPRQAEIMIQALESRRIPYAYLAFEGEQHGFRKAENIARSLQAELAFYGLVLGFEPADELPPPEVNPLGQLEGGARGAG